MEVAVAEEKKKIFRARKTMKISDRQQLETLHSVVLTGGAALSNPSPPPLLNGRHKEDGQRVLEKERNETSDSNSQATSPASPASHGSPIPLLSLNLSPSPPTCQSPKNKEENPTSPMSPFRSLNFELKKSEEEGTQGSSLNDIPGRISAGKDQDKKVAQEDAKTEKKKEEDTTVEQAATDSLKESVKNSVLESSPSVPDKKEDKDCRSEQDCTEDMEVDRDTTRTKTSPISSAQTAEKPSAKTSSSTSPHPVSSPPTIPEKDQEVKVEKPEDEKEMQGKMNEENLKKDVKEDKAEVKKVVEKMEVNLGEFKKERTDVGPKITKLSGPSSNPPPETVLADMPERSSTSGLKRPLTEGSDNKEKVERDGKRPKVEGVALEAQLELKITAKASSRLKLEKVVQQLVEDRLRVLQLTVFDQNLQELKERVEKIDCATKHQTTLNTLQAKIARLAKKFGEANQASENKRKQEALAAATAAAAAATAAAAKAAGATASPLTQRLVRTSMEVKQFPATPASTTTTVTPSQALSTPMPVLSSSIASSATVGPVVSAHTPILQLITSTANAVSSLAPGSITTQSPTGTLLVKTTPGSGMGQGQQLLIQLPLSVANGQTGTLVNLPVSTFSAVNSLSKAKTTTPTTFILKPATTMSGLQTTMSCLQTTMSPAQISLARAVYQGGSGGIGTPNAGVSVTTARAPAQFVSVAGAVSSTSSPATSGPAATGSAAPGPPQGTSLTSKTDNQTANCTPTKTTVSTPRPKGSVIDLTEDDDDVQVTGVKSATVTPSLSSPRPVITIPNNQARSSPQISPSSAGSPRVTVQHPPVDSQLKARPVSTATARAPATALPPLPSAPPPPGCLPIEAVQTTPPQQPQLKLVPSQTGIVLSWCVAETDRSCAQVDSYHLYAFHQDNSSSNSASQQWKRIGEVKALPLPMACTLTQFQSGSTYHFAVRAKDIYGRFGSFCEPQCTNVMHSNTS